MKILCIQHVPFERAGIIEHWAKSEGHRLEYLKIYEEEGFPNIDLFDMLIVLGGPMSFDDEDKYPWILPELEYIQHAIVKNKVILGICLGAQFIVRALGGNAVHGDCREIGWHKIKINSKELKKIGLRGLPKEIETFHWHSDTFEIPQGAIHWASSKAFANQAFIYKQRIAGLQFHFEATEESIASLIDNCVDELDGSEYVQNIEEINKGKKHLVKSNYLMIRVLNYLVSEQ